MQVWQNSRKVASLVLAWHRSSCNQQPVRTMASSHSSTVQVSQHRLNDREHVAYRFTPPASPDKPCIIFLHGLCSNMTG